MDFEQILRSLPTPCYLFDEAAFVHRAARVREAVGGGIGLTFSIKAGPFLLPHLPETFSYVEVCSPGELSLCEELHVAPEKIIFSGVNKTADDVERAVAYGCAFLTVESEKHLRLINEAGVHSGRQIHVLVRLSDESQFGVDEALLKEMIRGRAHYAGVHFAGLHYFTGTGKTRAKEHRRELARLDALLTELHENYGFTPEKVEYGPGLGVEYFPPLTVEERSEAADQTDMELLHAVAPVLKEFAEKYPLTIEMGRFFAAPAGCYLTQVVDVKTNDGTNYALIDGGLHQLKYDGQLMGMQIPVIHHLKAAEAAAKASVEDTAEATTPSAEGATEAPTDPAKWTIVGSLCTTQDVIARKVPLGEVQEGDRLLFERCGAYSVTEGMALFLSRDLPAVYLLPQDKDKPVMLRKPMDTSILNLSGAFVS